MCGLVGAYNVVDPDRALDSIAHRGPSPARVYNAEARRIFGYPVKGL